MMRPARIIALATVLVAFVGAVLWWRAMPPSAPVTKAGDRVHAPLAHASEVSTDRPSAVQDPTASTTRAPPLAERTPGLPASLQGTTPDGDVTLDAHGQVIATPGLRRLFDYFLSSIGELDVPAIRALLLAHVRALHGDLVADQVAAVFDRYIDYQQALSDAAPGLPSNLNDRLAFAKTLRRKFFDAETADAFFGEEEAYAEYTLERMRIQRDASLDEATRSLQMQALEAGLSAEQRASMQEANTAVIAEEQSRQFDTLRVDAAQRQEERSALFGKEAAGRLAELDRERTAWDQRLAAYVQARNAIRSNAALSAGIREQRIAQLRASSFDVNEARRVQSLESIGQL